MAVTFSQNDICPDPVMGNLVPEHGQVFFTKSIPRDRVDYEHPFFVIHGDKLIGSSLSLFEGSHDPPCFSADDFQWVYG